MIPQSKQIVIEKSAFDGIKTEELCDFAKHHVLLVSDSLLYECATSDDRRKVGLDRCERLIRAGAYWCTMSTEYIEWEGKNCHPYPALLANIQKTEWVRAQTESLENMLGPEITGMARNSRWTFAEEAYIQRTKNAGEDTRSNCPETVAGIKGLPRGRISRLRVWLEWADKSTIVREMALRLLPRQWISSPSQFCTSPQWITWQYLRLFLAIEWDYVHLRLSGGNPAKRGAEHDDQDAECVLLLSRADAIITRDKKLVEPLARAAFPNKDVFSSLEEVPESY